MRAFLICAVLLLSSIACFAADSPFTGTWKLKPKQGESGKGVAKVDSDVHTFNVDETVWDEKGQATKLKLDAKFDSKDYPVSDNPDFDSASVRRVSTHEVKVLSKKQESWPEKAISGFPATEKRRRSNSPITARLLHTRIARYGKSSNPNSRDWYSSLHFKTARG